MNEASGGRGPEESPGWSDIGIGEAVEVVKLSPDGSEAARYSGRVAAHVSVESWIVVQALWTLDRIELDGLSLCPDDRLLEWFSPIHDFNAFAVYAPDGPLKGWYANVTYPARLDRRASPPVLTWHDLYVDLVGLPDGTFAVRDESELDESGLREADPALFERIGCSRNELLRRFAAGVPPFSTTAIFHV